VPASVWNTCQLLYLQGNRCDKQFTGATYRSNPQRTGAYDTTAVHRFNEVIWKVKPAQAYTDPIVADGLLYFGGTNEYLYALDVQTGQEVWRFDGIFTSPTVASGSIYFGCADGYLCALDSRNGQEKWRFEAGHPILSSPAVIDETVYFGSIGSPEDRLRRYLYAVDSQTGQEKWRFETGGYVETAPAVARGIVYFATYGGYVVALDGSTGQALWRFQTNTWIRSGPAVADELVYIAGDSDHDYLIALDAYTGEEKWRVRAGQSPVAVADGVVYMGGHTTLYAFDGQTGQEIWRVMPDVNWGQPFRSAPSVADGMVYFGSYDGYLYALDAQTGLIKWQFQAGDYNVSSVAVADGVLYFRGGDGYIYAIR
jgi:outer membrane protein assembly factor BamB